MNLGRTISLFGCAAALVSSARAQSSFDLWDVSQGAVVTAASDLHPFAGTASGLLGEYGQQNAEYAWTYFNDGQPDGFVHFIEWETPADVTVGAVRVYAVGDGEWYNFGREFDQLTIKAKSPGSDVYDLTVLTVTPTHPYTFINPVNALIIDQAVTPITAHSFRAEFKQYSAGYGADGPRIIEIDGFSTPPPSVPSVSTDLFDSAQGAVVTAATDLHPAAGTPAGFIGFGGQNNFDESTWTYFADGLPPGTVHALEWQTSSNVTVEKIRLYAVGDNAPGYNNGREFAQFTLKAKSPGSATFDLTLLTFTPTHPYAFIDPDNYLVLDATLSTITTANSFRAEFLQYDAGNLSDGPRIIELDAFAPANPPSDPPPSDPPPSDPPPTDPPPTDPPPSDPPPSDPPPSDPPPSDPPPSDPPPSDPPPSDPPPSDPPPSDPPPSDPPPSDPPPSDPPPSDPPPSDPPPSDPPPSDPPPSDPPPVVVAPAIGTQPHSVTANYLTPVALWVEATGTAPLQYQWFKDGAALEGQTSQTLFVPAITSASAGVYHVTVSNSNGSAQSAAATIALDCINILPSAFDAWDSHMGSLITAHTDYATAGAPYGMLGAGSSSDDSGTTYFADAVNGAVHSVEWTTPAPVQVNTIRLFARGGDSGSREFGTCTLTAKSPGSATFDIVIGTFKPTHPYTLLDATTAAILDTEIAPIVATAFRAEFTQCAANGPGVIELDAFATRPLVKPAVVVPPQSTPLEKKGRALLTVLARGGSLTYQWKFNGVNIPGANASSFCIDAAKRPDQGNYSVVVSNALGSVESAPAFVKIVNRN